MTRRLVKLAVTAVVLVLLLVAGAALWVLHLAGVL
jgi:hypothetical protein